MKERATASNVIITTAQVRGKKAPLIIPSETVESMMPGSVIVDLASSTGGNCAFTEDKKTIVHGGVTIIGDSDLADSMPQDASFLYCNNIFNYLKILVKEGQLAPDVSDEIVAASWITQ